MSTFRKTSTIIALVMAFIGATALELRRRENEESRHSTTDAQAAASYEIAAGIHGVGSNILLLLGLLVFVVGASRDSLSVKSNNPITDQNHGKE